MPYISIYNLLALFTHLYVCVYVSTVMLLPVGLSASWVLSGKGVNLAGCSGVEPGGKGVCVEFIYHDRNHIVMFCEFSPKPSQTLRFLLLFIPFTISTLLTHKAESLCANIL